MEEIENGTGFRYASITSRFIALGLDGLIMIIPCAVAGRLIPVVGSVLVAILYSPIFESSSSQATIGKRLMGIQVVDLKGNRIPFSSALIRYFMKIVSSMICFLGYVIALFTNRRQTLHDLVAETLVIENKNKIDLADAWISQVKWVFFNLKSAGQKFAESEIKIEPSSVDPHALSALERLQALREKGALTEEEFQREKRKILDQG